jgi:hypothetical protein
MPQISGYAPMPKRTPFMLDSGRMLGLHDEPIKWVRKFRPGTCCPICQTELRDGDIGTDLRQPKHFPMCPGGREF